jgi:hypothetical protein
MLQGAADKQAEIEHTLDDYERELLQAIEEGQLAPTPGLIPDKMLLEAVRKPHSLLVKLSSRFLAISESRIRTR